MNPLLHRIRKVGGAGRKRARLMRSAATLEPRLVWIWGSPRSGSTWLLQLMAGNRLVVPVNEPLLGWYLGPFLSDLDGFGPEELTLDNFTLRRLQRAKKDQFFADEFTGAWGPALRDLILQRFDAHTKRYPPDTDDPSRALVAIKEPNGSQSADVIMGLLPRSPFLFLLRDGRDVVDSELAARLPGGWVSREFPGGTGIDEATRLDFVTRSAKRWLWRTEVVEQAFAAHPGPRHLLRYEELLADPGGRLRAIFEWLGAPVDERRIAWSTDLHDFENIPPEKRGSSEFYRAATPGLWRENLSDDEQAAVERVIGPKLRELGYA